MIDCSYPQHIPEHDDILCPAGLAICPTCSYEDGKRVKETGEPYEVWPSDSPSALAFWDGYYGKPLRDFGGAA